MSPAQVKTVLTKLGLTDDQMQVYPEKQRFQVSCPLAKWFHKHEVDQKPSMSVRLYKGRWRYKCFACMNTGSLWQLVQTVAQLREDEELSKLADSLLEEDDNLMLDMQNAYEGAAEWIRDENAKEVVYPPEMLKRFVHFDGSPHATEYIHSRAIDFGTARVFDLRVDFKYDRLVLPVYNKEGKLIGAQGRVMHEMTDNEQKYFCYWNFPKGNCIGGMNLITPESGTILVVEGFVDMMHIYPWVKERGLDIGFTFGAGITEKQADLLVGMGKIIQCWYDPDEAGEKGWQLMRKYVGSKAFGLKRAKLPEGVDPGKLSKDEFQKILDKTKIFL